MGQVIEMNQIDETLDEMLDSIKSINDDFINDFFDNSDKKTLDENLNKLQEEMDNEESKISFEENEQSEQHIELTEIENEDKSSNLIKRKPLYKENILSIIDSSKTGEEFFNKIDKLYDK